MFTLSSLLTLYSKWTFGIGNPSTIHEISADRSSNARIDDFCIRTDGPTRKEDDEGRGGGLTLHS